MNTATAKQPPTTPARSAVDAAALFAIFAWHRAARANSWSSWMEAASSLGGASSLAALMSETEAAADLHTCTLLAIERASLVREAA